MLSGIVPEFTKWHSDSPITRKVFGGIPSIVILVFYTVIPAMLVYGAVLFAFRVRNWERGTPDNRATTKKNLPEPQKHSSV